MILGGLQKFTLIDYPGHIAATVFTVGCNFRCPFCHNPELVHTTRNLAYRQAGTQHATLLEEELFKLLGERRGKLEGVCITGGEPTLQPDLVEFIGKIKGLGFKVKLDTNGARPDVLRRLFKEKLLDFVAMDIKSSPDRYNILAGGSIDIERVKLSADLVRNSGVDYEFRTTVVPGLHSEQDFAGIAKWLEGSKKYVLQKYEDKGKILDPNIKKKIKGKNLNLERIAKNVENYFGKVEIR